MKVREKSNKLVEETAISFKIKITLLAVALVSCLLAAPSTRIHKENKSANKRFHTDYQGRADVQI